MGFTSLSSLQRTSQDSGTLIILPLVNQNGQESKVAYLPRSLKQAFDFLVS